jgi:hypothetical protein
MLRQDGRMTLRARLVVLTAALVLVLTGCASGSAVAPPTVAAEPGPTTSLTTTVPSTTSTTIATAPIISSLPVGDGKLSRGESTGSVFACQTTFGPAGGAFRDGPWVHGDGTWDPMAKLHVQGSVAWPQGQYEVRKEGASRIIAISGVPAGHTTGVFPVAADDPAYQYDRNPNVISARPMTLTLPVLPVVAPSATCLNMGAIGVLSDGVVLFNALDALGRDAAAHEVLDGCDGHPERTGQYHHHEVPSCLRARATGGSTLLGYAFDGFGIYVERHPDGSLLANSELDACHGRTAPVMWDGETVSLYHYVATAEYPYTLGCYRGTPVAR